MNYPSVRWRVTVFLAAVGALNYADRSAMAAVLAPIRAEFRLSDAALGLVASLFLWAYALGSSFAGILADRSSRSLVVVASLAIWSLCMGLTGWAGGLTALCLCRIGLGVGESPFHPAAFALVADHQPPGMRARAMSIVSIGLRFGPVVGGAGAGYLAERFGWRSGFWVLGATGVALALTARFFLTDASHPPRPPRPRSRTGEAVRSLAGNRSYLLILAKQISAGAITWIFATWLPLYLLESFHLKLGAAGFLGTFMLSGSLVIGLGAGGWISDFVARRGSQYRMLAFGGFYLAAAPFLLVFLAQPGFGSVVVLVASVSFFRAMGDASEHPITSEIVPARHLATAYGVINTFATASGGLGVLLAGILKRNVGLNAVFAGSSVLFLLTGLSLVIGSYRCMPRDIVRAHST